MCERCILKWRKRSFFFFFVMYVWCKSKITFEKWEHWNAGYGTKRLSYWTYSANKLHVRHSLFFISFNCVPFFFTLVRFTCFVYKSFSSFRSIALNMRALHILFRGCFRAAHSLRTHTHNLKCNFHSNKLFKYCMQFGVWYSATTFPMPPKMHIEYIWLIRLLLPLTLKWKSPT